MEYCSACCDKLDPQVHLMHIAEQRRPVPENEIEIQLSTSFNRQNDSLLEKDFQLTNNISMVDDVWEKRLLKNKRLFNGSKFRLHMIKTSKHEDKKYLFCVGVTDYKEYLGTNWAPSVEKLEEEGLKIHNNPQAYLSDALGVGAFVITKDEFVVLQRRNTHLAEAGGLWDVPGGHAEPSELVGKVPLESIDLPSMKKEDVAHEIFSSITREVIDEVNIPALSLEAPLYLGTARNTTSAGRPSMAFEIRTKLSKEEVTACYNKGNQCEADESTMLTFVPLGKIPYIQSENDELWKNMAPSAKGNITIYCLAYGLISYKNDTLHLFNPL